MPQPKPDDADWISLLVFQAEVAMAYRRANAKLRDQLTERGRQIEMYQRLVADFERQEEDRRRA